MVTPRLQHVSAWLEELTPKRGAFVHAVEWACRLDLPLHGLVTTRGNGLGPKAFPLRAPIAVPVRPGPSAPDNFEACAAVCRQKGIAWELAFWQGALKPGVEHFLRPTDLCIFDSTLAPELKNQLLRKSLRSRPTSILVCPATCKPVPRVLVLAPRSDSAPRFLHNVAEICKALATAPVVLTVADSAAQARAQQQQAEKTFATQAVPADFDFAVGCDVDTAVTRVARWRDCTHLFLEQQQASPWRRWFPGNTVERLFRLSDKLAILALPAAPTILPDVGTGPVLSAPRSLR